MDQLLLILVTFILIGELLKRDYGRDLLFALLAAVVIEFVRGNFVR